MRNLRCLTTLRTLEFIIFSVSNLYLHVPFKQYYTATLLNEGGVVTDAVCDALVERNVVTMKFPWEAVAVPRSVPTVGPLMASAMLQVQPVPSSPSSPPAAVSGEYYFIHS